MSPDEIESKVKEIICNQLEVSPEQLRPEASFIDDLKADSLAVVELVLIVVLAAFVLYVSSGYVKQMAGLDARSQNAGIPMWIPHGMVALGFLLILIVAVCGLVHLAQRLTARPAGGSGTAP